MAVNVNSLLNTVFLKKLRGSWLSQINWTLKVTLICYDNIFSMM